MDDLQLVHTYARTGDPAAISELVQRHRKAVLATCWRKLGSGSDAEDATQEVFLALMNQAGEIHTNVGAWLHRCAQNVANAMIRSRRNRKRWEMERALIESDQADGDQLLSQERFTILEESLKELDAVDHELLLRNCVHGSNQQEIASSLGVSQQSVSKRLTRIVTRLRHGLRLRGVVGSVAMLLVLSTRKVANAAIPTRWAATIAGGSQQDLAETSARLAMGMKVAAASAMVYAATVGEPTATTTDLHPVRSGQQSVDVAKAEVIPAMPVQGGSVTRGAPTLLAAPTDLAPLTSVPTTVGFVLQLPRAVQEADAASRSLLSDGAPVARLWARPPERQGITTVTVPRNAAPVAAAPSTFSAPARVLVLKAEMAALDNAPAGHVESGDRDVAPESHAEKGTVVATQTPPHLAGVWTIDPKVPHEFPEHAVALSVLNVRGQPTRITGATALPLFGSPAHWIKAGDIAGENKTHEPGYSFVLRMADGEELPTEFAPWTTVTLATADLDEPDAPDAVEPMKIVAAGGLPETYSYFKHMAPLGEVFTVERSWRTIEADERPVALLSADAYPALARMPWRSALASGGQGEFSSAQFAMTSFAPGNVFSFSAMPLPAPEPASVLLLVPGLVVLLGRHRR